MAWCWLWVVNCQCRGQHDLLARLNSIKAKGLKAAIAAARKRCVLVKSGSSLFTKATLDGEKVAYSNYFIGFSGGADACKYASIINALHGFVELLHRGVRPVLGKGYVATAMSH